MMGSYAFWTFWLVFLVMSLLVTLAIWADSHDGRARP